MGVVTGADDYLLRGFAMTSQGVEQPVPRSHDGVDLIWDQVSATWIDPRSMPNRYAGGGRTEPPKQQD